MTSATEEQASSSINDLIQRQSETDARLARVEAAVGHTSEQVERVSKSIDRLADRFVTSQRTPWGVFAAWAGVCITIVIGLVGMGAYGPLKALDETRDNLKEVDAAIHHHTSDGHPFVVIERVEDVKSRLEAHLNRKAHPWAIESIARLEERVRALEKP